MTTRVAPCDPSSARPSPRPAPPRQPSTISAGPVAAGYGPGPVVDLAGLSCIDNSQVGAMGVHYVNGSRFSVHLSEREPQALIYEPQDDGSQRLVGAEYLVFAEPWKAAHGDKVPRLFGRDFHLFDKLPATACRPSMRCMPGLRRPNPLGPFADWNPAVRCP